MLRTVFFFFFSQPSTSSNFVAWAGCCQSDGSIPGRCERFTCVISGFHREADENCALLCYYAASSSNFLPTFRDNLSVPSSNVQESNPLALVSVRGWVNSRAIVWPKCEVNPQVSRIHSFHTHFCYRLSQPHGHSVAKGWSQSSGVKNPLLWHSFLLQAQSIPGP
jgi:hypothetical protein